MKKRAFFTTLILFLLFFNTMLCGITCFLLKERLAAITERALSEQAMLVTMIWEDMQAFEDKESLNRENIQEAMQQYALFVNSKTTLFSLYDREGFIYESGKTEEGLKEMLLQTEKDRQEGYRYTGFWPGTFPVYYITGMLPKPYETYQFFYGCHLTDVMKEWEETRFLLFSGGSVLSLLLAACLLFMIRKIFSPLSRIAQISGEIAKGQYEKRLPVNGGAEIEDMARSFNNMTDKIQRQIEELDLAASRKQEFIDAFAHELKTPLTAIYGYAEYLQKAAVSEQDRQEALQFIMSECRRIQNMETQLLDLALLRENQFPKEAVNAARFFMELEIMLLPMAEKKKVSLLFQCETETLYGNRGLLQHLLTNLINNAIQSCGENGRVKIRAYKEEGTTVIQVVDNGRGMKQSEAAHITEAFYRIDQSRSREEGGVGLGLAICSKIAETEQIEMEFLSAPGKGTTVFLTFTGS